jgi:TetR/AcrR family transcriptional regulator
MDNPDHIREVATRMFAQRGFSGTSLQAIADEVGVTKPTLLYHYPSKAALRRAVLDNLLKHWRERLPRLLEAFTSGQARFDALTGELINFFSTDPDRARLVVRELLDHPDELRAGFVETLRPWILLVSEYIRQGQSVGLIHEDVDAESYVLHVITLVTGAVAAHSPLVRVLATDADAVKAFQERYFIEIARLARSALFKPPYHRLQPGAVAPARASGGNS